MRNRNLPPLEPVEPDETKLRLEAEKILEKCLARGDIGAKVNTITREVLFTAEKTIASEGRFFKITTKEGKEHLLEALVESLRRGYEYND